MNIDQVPASRELDKLVAEALDWTEVVYHRAPGAMLHGIPPVGTSQRALVDAIGIKYRVPEYSNDDSQALDALKSFSQQGWDWELKHRFGDSYTQCILTNLQLPFQDWTQATGGDTLALAICRAILKAASAVIRDQAWLLRLNPDLKGAPNDQRELLSPPQKMPQLQLHTGV